MCNIIYNVLVSAAPHKAGRRVDPRKWETELRQFFDWVECRILSSDNQAHNLVGNKNIRRKIARACRTFTIQMEKAFPHAPALQSSIADILELVRDLSTWTNGSMVVKSPIGNMRLWRDQIGIKQSMSVDWDRHAREQEQELLLVARIVAPVVGARHRFESIKKHLSFKQSCAVRSVDEILRRARREIEKGGGLIALIEKYFEQFKLANFYGSHPGKRYKYPPMEKLTRITALTDCEVDSISRLCETHSKVKIASATSKPRRATRPQTAPLVRVQKLVPGADPQSGPP